MATNEPSDCGCPPTAPAVPSIGGVHHVILSVTDLQRSRPFYAALMPRLGYPAIWDYGMSVGFVGAGGSFWIKQADARFAADTFCKDRVGLCEVAFRAESRAQVDALARDLTGFGGTILDAPREYPEYVPGYYAVFFADPDGMKLELVHIPG
jgi:catechol 2,3-dioxygenase-like lactoylglutathione lyase family enzyme